MTPTDAMMRTTHDRILTARAAKARRDEQILATISTILVNPVTMLVGGFVLTNVLENTQMGTTKVATTTTSSNNFLKIIFPVISIFIPDKTTTIPAGAPINVLTEDQANVLRAGLVLMASAQSGLLTALGGGIGGIVKAVA